MVAMVAMMLLRLSQYYGRNPFQVIILNPVINQPLRTSAGRAAGPINICQVHRVDGSERYISDYLEWSKCHFRSGVLIAPSGIIWHCSSWAECADNSKIDTNVRGSTKVKKSGKRKTTTNDNSKLGVVVSILESIKSDILDVSNRPFRNLKCSRGSPVRWNTVKISSEVNLLFTPPSEDLDKKKAGRRSSFGFCRPLFQIAFWIMVNNIWNNKLRAEPSADVINDATRNWRWWSIGQKG